MLAAAVPPNGVQRTVLAPTDALAWIEADHGAFWAYAQAAVLDPQIGSHAR